MILMLTYQIIVLILSIVAILAATYRFRNNAFSNSNYLLWLITWILIIIIALFPNITSFIANTFGFGRGLDAILVLATILIFYILFKLYNKIEDQRRRINQLVSQLAVYNQEKELENMNNPDNTD
ncbi:MAG: DUF2304 family protein [Methanosphaera stadtmanae]|nr:DUF2304 family protein [Methanosphaera stadtmanae]